MKMSDFGWDKVSPYFSRDENWGDPDNIDSALVYGLYKLRAFVGRPIHIHCGVEARQTFSYHSIRMAVDCHIEDMHPIDQFLVFSRFDTFTGIGIYFRWNHPGCHVDVRPLRQKLEHDARWVCFHAGVYETLDLKALKRGIT